MSHYVGNISSQDDRFRVLYCDHDLILNHLAESLVFAGFPMRASIPAASVGLEVESTLNALKNRNLNTIDFKRAMKLGQAKGGGGHDCFLKGITVSAVFKAPQYFWQQIKRYHFFDIISSQSTMHRIVSMDIQKNCTKDTDERIIKIVNEYIALFTATHDQQYFQKIISNLPSGFMLSAGITTNYLQLKTIANQRGNHKLPEWSVNFMDFIYGLPYFKILVGCE